MMQQRTLEKFLAALPAAESGHPFGPEALVYKVYGKMFALVTQQQTPARLTLKVRPADGEELIGMYESVIPGYHMNKRHWITITLNGELPATMIKELAEKSYRLVVATLKRADREKLRGI